MAAQTVVQVQLVLRLTLGLIFIISSGAKLRDPAAFVRGVLEYQVLPPPLAQLYGRLLPFAELGTGLLLLSGLVVPVAAGLAALMLTSFAAAVASNVARGRALSCHCFGEHSVSRSGWHALAGDLVLLLVALWSLKNSTHFSSVATALLSDPRTLIPAVVLAALLALTYLLGICSITRGGTDQEEFQESARCSPGARWVMREASEGSCAAPERRSWK
jgi:uncharacterized membrane protein YphA (DoxX/SURF4 family)